MSSVLVISYISFKSISLFKIVFIVLELVILNISHISSGWMFTDKKLLWWTLNMVFTFFLTTKFLSCPFKSIDVTRAYMAKQDSVIFEGIEKGSFCAPLLGYYLVLGRRLTLIASCAAFAFSEVNEYFAITMSSSSRIALNLGLSPSSWRCFSASMASASFLAF